MMHPRFTIHSWNDDQTVNEPWMYPAVTPAIRSAIELRYRLLPYFYTLLWQASADDEPMLRPTFLDHEQDSTTLAETDDFMLGRDILVASVVEPGQRQRAVYLPANTSGWYDFHSGQWFSGGQTIVLDAPLERLPLLVRAGAMIPLSGRTAYVSPQKDEQREFLLFPPVAGGTDSGLLFEDDGETWQWREGNALWLRWEIRTDSQRIDVTFTPEGRYQPAWRHATLRLPVGEQRQLYINGVHTATYQHQ